MSEPTAESSASSSPASPRVTRHEHHNRFYVEASVDLRNLSAEDITLPKFWLGQSVVWARVSPHGYGTILGMVFANGVSVEAQGYHYLVLLSADSPEENCLADWAFEDDLDLYQPEVSNQQSLSNLP